MDLFRYISLPKTSFISLGNFEAFLSWIQWVIYTLVHSCTCFCANESLAEVDTPLSILPGWLTHFSTDNPAYQKDGTLNNTDKMEWDYNRSEPEAGPSKPGIYPSFLLTI